MNNKDLNYLLSSIKGVPRNTYKNISIGTNSSHLNYLKRSNINYSVKEHSVSEKEIAIYSKNGKFIDSFVFPFYPNTSNIASNITKDKFKLEKHFKENHINTTTSRLYDIKDVKTALTDFKKENTEHGAVIKPLSSSLGKGVFVNVPVERFEQSWQSSYDDLSVSDKKNNKDLKVIVQNYIPGFEVRVTILQGSLISIIARIPPYVTGDGKNSIKELIKFKNKERKNCRYLSKYPIKITNKINEFMYSQGITLNTIPKKGENLLLSSVSNINAGGEMINITDYVTHNIKDFALDALASIPGIYSGGLDIMLTSFNDQNPVVIEVNTYPVISLTKYPTYGKQANPSKILFNSLISQYQIGKNSNNQYEIKNQDLYIKDFLDFTKRRMKFI